MKHAQQSDSPFSDRHDVVKVVCLWRNGTCRCIEVVGRTVKPVEHESYAALLWIEEEHGAGRRIIVRDVTFPRVHHESAELALDYAIAFPEAKLKLVIGLEAKAESS